MLEGSCHCGKVSFTVDTETPKSAISCNCSHCRRKGFLLAFFPPDKFTLGSGENALKSYFFNTHKIEHQFCTNCGCEAFAQGSDREGKKMMAVNLRCVENIDLDALDIKHYDGAKL